MFKMIFSRVKAGRKRHVLAILSFKLAMRFYQISSGMGSCESPSTPTYRIGHRENRTIPRSSSKARKHRLQCHPIRPRKGPAHRGHDQVNGRHHHAPKLCTRPHPGERILQATPPAHRRGKGPKDRDVRLYSPSFSCFFFWRDDCLRSRKRALRLRPPLSSRRDERRNPPVLQACSHMNHRMNHQVQLQTHSTQARRR